MAAKNSFLGSLIGEIGGLARDAARDLGQQARDSVKDWIGRQVSTVKDKVQGTGGSAGRGLTSSPAPAAGLPAPAPLAGYMPWVLGGAGLLVVLLLVRRR